MSGESEGNRGDARALRTAILALSPLANDSRVLRCAQLLHNQGHRVRVFAQPPFPGYSGFEIVPLPAPASANRHRLRLLLQHAPANILAKSASWLFWLDPGRRMALAELRKFSPDIVIANDWNTLPIAGVLKRETGTRIIYDSHEFATAEFEERLAWRLLMRNHVRAIERTWIGEVDAIFTVSQGIAEALQQLYHLPRLPMLLRNVPDAPTFAANPTGETIRVLFHGLLRPNRGLEPLIDSLPMWRPDRSLIIRGYGNQAYRAGLFARALALGVDDRLSIEDAVAPAQVIEAARTADIGIFVLPSSSRQNRFALPNKMFEYISATLALAVTPLTEMKAVIEHYECGVLIGETPPEIAAAINDLDRGTIDRFKRGSEVASKELTWQIEGRKLLDCVQRLAREFA